MGFDEVTWNPRLGTDGDARYEVSGATRIDGSLDNGEPTRIEAGDASAFDEIPSIEQLNNCTGLNAIIGYLNRRALLSGASTMEYVVQDDAARYAVWSLLRDRINALRLYEGFPDYAWPAPFITGGTKITGAHLAHLRRALRLSGLLYKQLAREYPTYRWKLQSGVESIENTGVQMFGVCGHTASARYRAFDRCAIPALCAGCADAGISGEINFQIVPVEGTAETIAVNIHRFPVSLDVPTTGDMNPPVADAGGLSIPYAAYMDGALPVYTVSAQALSALAGGHCAFELYTTGELNDEYNGEAYVYVRLLDLTIDFGE